MIHKFHNRVHPDSPAHLNYYNCQNRAYDWMINKDMSTNISEIVNPINPLEVDTILSPEYYNYYRCPRHCGRMGT